MWRTLNLKQGSARAQFDKGAGDRDITVLLVKVSGKSNAIDKQVSYSMVDVYDEEKNVTSMAKTTGYTAAIIARMVAKGEIRQKGSQWPIYIIKGTLFKELLEKLQKRGVTVKETVTKNA